MLVYEINKNPKKGENTMLTYVRVRTVKAGKYQGALDFIKKYKAFIQSELGVDTNFGAEVGRVGTIVSMSQFDNAQAWEDSMDKLRSNSEYIALTDESFNFFEDDIMEHLVVGLPV